MNQIGNLRPFSMTWSDGLFVHWPFPPDALHPHVPAVLELDTFDGLAWASLLPFVLSDAGFRFAPSFTKMTTPELNFRTYVRFDGHPGLYFFSIDIGSRLIPPLVRLVSGLPCYEADMAVRHSGEHVVFSSTRQPSDEPAARFELTYRPTDEQFRAEPGTLDHWLVERRRLYVPTDHSILAADVAHQSWPLQTADATIQANTLFERRDLSTPDCEPRIRYSAKVPMTVSLPRRIR